MTARLTDADLAEIARLNEVAQPPEQQPHAGRCYCPACNNVRTRRWAALDARESLLGSDAIGRLLAELSATRRERNEAYRTADQLREGVRGLEAEVDALRKRDAAMVNACNEIADAIALVKQQMEFDDEASIHDVLDSFRSTASELHECIKENAQLRSEQAADRAAVRALVEALPECERSNGCGGAVATVRFNEPGGPADGSVYCDDSDCVPRIPASGLRKYMTDLVYAAPLRVLLDRMATWGEAAVEPAAPDADPEDIVAHERDVASIWRALASVDDPATTIDWPAFWERRARLGSDAEAIEAPARETIRWMEQEREMGAEGAAFLFAPSEQPKATFRLRSPDEVLGIALRHSARIKAGEDGGEDS